MDFGFVSDFGFRISDFLALSPLLVAASAAFFGVLVGTFQIATTARLTPAPDSLKRADPSPIDGGMGAAGDRGAAVIERAPAPAAPVKSRSGELATPWIGDFAGGAADWIRVSTVSFERDALHPPSEFPRGPPSAPRL